MPEIPAPGPQTILAGRSFIASVNRVAEFIRQWRMKNDASEIVYGVHMDVNAKPIELTIDDLEAVLRRATPVMYPDREALAFTLFATDNRNATPEIIRAEYDRLRAEQKAAGEVFYCDPLADAAIEAFRLANS